MISKSKAYILKEGEPFTEEEERELDEYAEREGTYWGNDPETIAKLQKQMMEDEEFLAQLKAIEEDIKAGN